MRRRTGSRICVLLLLVGVGSYSAEPGTETVDASRSVRLSVVIGAKGRVVQLPRKVRFVLSGEAAGLFLQVDAQAHLSTQPVGVTLPFGPPRPLLSLSYDAAAGKAQVWMRQDVIASQELDLAKLREPALFLLRQRDQLALWALPPQGGDGTLVRLLHADYTLRLRPIRDYGLCESLTYRMGDRKLTAEEFQTGIRLDCLDEVKDVVVRGTDPSGKPFVHTYKLPYQALQDRLDRGYEAISDRVRQEWQEP